MVSDTSDVAQAAACALPAYAKAPTAATHASNFPYIDNDSPAAALMGERDCKADLLPG
jgi:hypothetical protein